MAVVTGANIAEFKAKEMARRAGQKYEPESKNPFAGMSKEQLKEQKTLIKEAKKALKSNESE